jgi:hypothetical protein
MTRQPKKVPAVVICSLPAKMRRTSPDFAAESYNDVSARTEVWKQWQQLEFAFWGSEAQLNCA